MNFKSKKFKLEVLFFSIIVVLLFNYFSWFLNFNPIISLLSGDISTISQVNISDVIKITAILTGETWLLSYGFYYVSKTVLKWNYTSK